VTARLFKEGRPFDPAASEVEDHAVVRVDVAGGAVLSLACSWFLPAGRDAVIAATFYGTEGGVSMTNVDGSFYDFRTERFRGTQREELAGPPDEWGGRAAVEWTRRLADGAGFEEDVRGVVSVARVIDEVYGGCEEPV
jgi:predicted dehydrogenase